MIAAQSCLTVVRYALASPVVEHGSSGSGNASLALLIVAVAVAGIATAELVRHHRTPRRPQPRTPVPAAEPPATTDVVESSTERNPRDSRYPAVLLAHR